MSSKTQTFRSPEALARIKSIHAHLQQEKLATVDQLAQLENMSPQCLGAYLRHMVTIGRAHRAEPAKAVNGGCIPAKWAAGPSPVDLTDYDDTAVDEEPQQVVVLTHWRKPVARDPFALPAGFFAPSIGEVHA